MDSQTLIDIVLKLVAITVAFTVVLLIVAYTVLAERRVLGLIQGRLGPNRVGPGGILQPFADLLKFILKEDIVPDKSTRFIYFLAPVIATMAALMTMIVYPFGPDTRIPFTSISIPLVVARFDIGLLYVLGITSVGVYGIMLAGWSSNNKYSLMGGLRSSAQMISYELALGLSLIGPILLAGTLDLAQVVDRAMQIVSKLQRQLVLSRLELSVDRGVAVGVLDDGGALDLADLDLAGAGGDLGVTGDAVGGDVTGRRAQPHRGRWFAGDRDGHDRGGR